MGKKMKAYALKNLECSLSSSGGAFPTIVKEFFQMTKQHGISKLLVYGAAWQKDFSVKHERIDYEQGIERFSGSKYVWSEIHDIANQIIRDLIDGSAVVFSGTPCQVDAIKKSVSKYGVDSKWLLLIDLICHGTPNVKLWSDYFNLIQSHYSTNITNICFRDKMGNSRSGGKLVLTFSDGTRIENDTFLKHYMRLFSRNLSLRKGCFTCRYRNTELKRPGDITVGDFWGVKEIFPNFDKCGDVSLVLTNSEKGEKLFNRIVVGSKHEVMVGECQDDSFLKYNPHLYKLTQMPKNYEQFWTDYKQMDFTSFENKWAKEPLIARIKVILSNIASVLGIKYKLKSFLHDMVSNKK